MAGKRLVVIEDDPANLRLMVLLLKAAGHQVIGASNGTEGLDAVRKEIPDLILCDGRMPDMSGIEVVQTIRGDAAMANIPVVAVTGLVRDVDSRELLAAGFNGYIAKPFDIKTFAVQVAGFLPEA